jgi:hypothetical protein
MRTRQCTLEPPASHPTEFVNDESHRQLKKCETLVQGSEEWMHHLRQVVRDFRHTSLCLQRYLLFETAPIIGDY